MDKQIKRLKDKLEYAVNFANFFLSTGGEPRQILSRLIVDIKDIVNVIEGEDMKVSVYRYNFEGSFSGNGQIQLPNGLTEDDVKELIYRFVSDELKEVPVDELDISFHEILED